MILFSVADQDLFHWIRIRRLNITNSTSVAKKKTDWIKRRILLTQFVKQLIIWLLRRDFCINKSVKNTVTLSLYETLILSFIVVVLKLLYFSFSILYRDKPAILFLCHQSGDSHNKCCGITIIACLYHSALKTVFAHILRIDTLLLSL